MLEAKSIEGKMATEEQKHEFDGAVIEVEVRMPAKGEPDWAKRVRKDAAVALRHIPPTGKHQVTTDQWMNKSMGQKVMITTAYGQVKNDETDKWEDDKNIVIPHKFNAWAMADTPEPEIDVDSI